MKKYINYSILFLLGAAYVMIFKYSPLIKTSIIESMILWAKNLVPSMLPAYIILDLLLNYGILEVFYKVFKNNVVILVQISMIAGTPTNAKYIREFYEEGYISLDTANFLLMFSYSPNPLFILAFSPTFAFGVCILCTIYFTNAIIFLIFRPKFSLSSKIVKDRPVLSFVDCLSDSIANSFKILILILGVVVVYGVINTFMSLIAVDSLLISSILELTNALLIIDQKGGALLWMTFACLFGGLSIHTQIKSILDESGLSYKFFLFGRLIASIPVLVLIFLGYLF